ncbi:MAG: hypothetical protein ACM3UZ_04205 [Acidobacteriota bacterium]
MIKDGYFELLKTITIEDCPTGFTRQVLARSGINENQRKRLLSSESWVERGVYGIGSLVVMVLMIIVIIGGIHDSSRMVHERMATNSIEISGQFTDAVREVIIEKERGDL